jgi:hypothetical protein
MAASVEISVQPTLRSELESFVLATPPLSSELPDPAKYSEKYPDLSHMTIHDSIEDLQLEAAYRRFVIDDQGSIPYLIWLLENPASPIALPGSVDLYGHDCLHLLLNRGVSSYDEAFVIGFTMGNSEEVEPHHLSTLKFCARFIYPPPFRFNKAHLKIFDLGAMYGRKVPHRNLHKVIFDDFAKETIGSLRTMFGISLSELKLLWDMEIMAYPR